MKRIWNIVRFVVVSGLAAAALLVSVSAQATKVKEGAEKTKDAVVKGTTVAVDKTKDALSKTGEVMTDAWVTTRVHQRFVGEALLKDSNISVDSDKHVVTLKGTVTSLAGRRRATTVAKGTEGVHSVVNHLTIGPKKN